MADVLIVEDEESLLQTLRIRAALDSMAARRTAGRLIAAQIEA